MKKSNLLSALVCLTLAFTVACSKKAKEEGGAEGDGATPDTSIDGTPMTFDAQGSDSGKIAGLNTIYFGYDQTLLSAEAKRNLQANAEWIKANGNYNVQIEGHCDERGSIEYNLALGERRAKAVRAYLTSLGVDSNRLSIISYGEEKPMEQGDTDAVYSRNRRANFLPLSK